MNRRVPPNPAQFRSVQEWAQQFYEYFASSTRVGESNEPLPIQLPFRTTGDERAAQAGVILYCSSCEEAIISDGTQYLSITNVPSFSAADIGDQTAIPNTTNKYAGRVVYDETNLTLAVANGNNATDTWSRLTVAATVTPS